MLLMLDMVPRNDSRETKTDTSALQTSDILSVVIIPDDPLAADLS